MAITKYEATFTTSEGAEFIATREYARPLAYAWRVEYTANGQPGVKLGFSATKEAAEKSLKQPKRCTVTHSQVVPAVSVGEVASKAKAAPKGKAKKAKPCKAGEVITVRLGCAEITGTVAKVGREYAYVKIDGALDPVKVAFASIVAPSPEPLPLAQAA